MAPIPLAEVIRNNIKTMRETRAWSQSDLAARLRVLGLTRCTRNAIAQIETGKVRTDRVLDLALFAQAFGVPLIDLLAGDGQVQVDPQAGTAKPLVDLRMAVVGYADPPELDVHQQIAEEYNLDRIVVQAGLDDVGELRMICMAIWGQQDFLTVRDERAGIDIIPGTRASIAGRRGQATKEMVSEIVGAVAATSVSHLVLQGIAKLHARATDMEAAT